MSGSMRLHPGMYSYRGCIIRKDDEGPNTGQWAIYDHWQHGEYLDTPIKRAGYYRTKREAMRDVDRNPADRFGDLGDDSERALDSSDIPHRIVKKSIRRIPRIGCLDRSYYGDTEYTFAEHGQAKVLCWTYKGQVELRGTATNAEWAELIQALITDIEEDR